MARFGVAEQQVRRDHVISHILATLSRDHRDELIFFGGTALSRTHLRHERLSEDIDLIATGRRNDLAAALIDDLGAALARTHGRIIWSPAWSMYSDVEAATAVTPDGTAVKIQLLGADRYEPWPTEVRQIEQRYRDAPPASLRVPTLASFAGWKTALGWIAARRAISTTCGRWPRSARLMPRRRRSSADTGRPAANRGHGCSTVRRQRRNGMHSLPVRPNWP
jgi:hypothetical protein